MTSTSPKLHWGASASFFIERPLFLRHQHKLLEDHIESGIAHRIDSPNVGSQPIKDIHGRGPANRFNRPMSRSIQWH